MIHSRGIQGYKSWSFPKDSNVPVAFGWSLSFSSGAWYPSRLLRFLVLFCIHLWPHHMGNHMLCTCSEVSPILGHSPNRTSQSSSWGRFLDHDILPSTLELKLNDFKGCNEGKLELTRDGNAFWAYWILVMWFLGSSLCLESLVCETWTYLSSLEGFGIIV